MLLSAPPKPLTRLNLQDQNAPLVYASVEMVSRIEKRKGDAVGLPCEIAACER